MREIRDGLRVFALRAEHAVAVYEGALAVRGARAAGRRWSAGPLGKALSRARALTDAARQVVRRREADYRYPAALTIAGGERGTAPRPLPNRTVYPYRYLSRTHRLTYWTRPDEQLAALVRRALARSGQPVAAATGQPPPLLFPRGSLKVESPRAGAAAGGAAARPDRRPGRRRRALPRAAPAGRRRGGEAPASPPDPWRAEREGGRPSPADLPLPCAGWASWSSARRRCRSTRRAARPRPALTIRGRLRTDDIVALMTKTGGFEATGARTVLALTLGYTPGRLPEAVPLALRAEGRVARHDTDTALLR